ncbi:interleukin-17 receptor C [Trichomycterus rosablanca]|uniref:interleukin-17 receptor C n=1 Tax=Trichomycterus rosablanca TaxID=2290929 RepID=UPI002F3576AB
MLKINGKGGTCVYYESYVIGLAAHALLCHSDEGWLPCLRIQLNITATGFHEDLDQYAEASYETGSGMKVPIHVSPSIQVCYQGSDFFGSRELTFTPISDDSTTEMWMSLVVMLEKVHFGSEVHIFCPPSLKHNFSIHVSLPAEDTVCSHGLGVEWCKAPILMSEINVETGMARLHLDALDNRRIQDMRACQRNGNGECTELKWDQNPLMIPLSSVIPCLCIQIWWETEPRKEFCPFVNNTVLSSSNVSVTVEESQTHDAAVDRDTSALAWNITAPCKLQVELHLCKKPAIFGKGCFESDDLKTRSHQIHNQSNPDWKNSNRYWKLQGEFLRVQRHPSLCVQIKVRGIEGYFDPICPYEFNRAYWSLSLLAGLVLICLTVLGAYAVQGTLKGWVFRWLKVDNVSSKVGGGQVVLLYPPDADTALAELVCHLGSALSSLGFGVSSELWSRAELNALGPVPWLHSRLHRLQCYGGKVVIILTRAAWARAEEWCQSRAEKDEHKETYSDVFSASLSCILADYLQGRAGERFVLVQFETQPAGPPNEKGSMPELFRGLPLFSLPSQSLGFLTELTQGAHEVQRANESTVKRRTRAGVLRAGARTLTRTLRELTGGAGYRMVGISQDCMPFGKDDPWATIPLRLESLTPQSSPEFHTKNCVVDEV